MQANQKNLFEQFSKLARNVKQDFKTKGLIVPSRAANGEIQVGDFTIFKRDHRYYVRNNKETVAGPLNLAQTAVLVANDLALGKHIDTVLVRNDTWYGYREFDERVANNIVEQALKEKDYDRADLSRYKAILAQEQKLQYKKSIESRYNKLYRLT